MSQGLTGLGPIRSAETVKLPLAQDSDWEQLYVVGLPGAATRQRF